MIYPVDQIFGGILAGRRISERLSEASRHYYFEAIKSFRRMTQW
jgi:hypothetical protein